MESVETKNTGRNLRNLKKAGCGLGQAEFFNLPIYMGGSGVLGHGPENVQNRLLWAFVALGASGKALFVGSGCLGVPTRQAPSLERGLPRPKKQPGLGRGGA